MASFTGVGDNTTLSVPLRGETVSVAISGTYSMQIDLQRELGAPGSGAWVTLESWDTANATVAYDYVTKSFNENLRLIVQVDTSGTATATLTSSASGSDLSHFTVRDPLGNIIADFRESGLHVPRGLIRGSDSVVPITASTTLTKEEHAGRIVAASAAAGLTVTLPAATGTGDPYTIFFAATVTSNDYIVQAASSSDVFLGGVSISTDIAGVTMLTAATTDTITMNGSTTGGLLGSFVRLTDVASGQFMLEGFLKSTGTEATPFSAAV
jgi:hypothetical protein